jgi:hypothetical protein
MTRRDESKRARRMEGEHKCKCKICHYAGIALRARGRELTIGNVESKGTQAADEARRRSATARGFRRRGGGKEEQGGDVGAEGERDTERIPGEIPNELT